MIAYFKLKIFVNKIIHLSYFDLSISLSLDDFSWVLRFLHVFLSQNGGFYVYLHPHKCILSTTSSIVNSNGENNAPKCLLSQNGYLFHWNKIL